jgi:hypothetical protein
MEAILTYVAWAILLIIQNASFTLVSRARNSGSYAFHAAAAVGSNGVWFASQFILIGSIMEVAKSGTLLQAIGLGVFYTVFTIIGSVGMHWVSANYIETGKRKIGS